MQITDLWFGQLANYFMTVFIGNWIENFHNVQRRKYNTIVNIWLWNVWNDNIMESNSFTALFTARDHSFMKYENDLISRSWGSFEFSTSL